MVYNISEPAGSRVHSVKVRAKSGYKDLDDDVNYRVAVNSFLADGGDGIDAVSAHAQNRVQGEVDVDVLAKYVRKFSPLSLRKDGRLKVIR